MGKNYPAASLLVLLALTIFGSCSSEKYQAQQPLYLDIPAIDLKHNPERDSSKDGSLHHAISAVWVIVNGKSAGTFELPATVPVVLEEGDNKVELLPGIKLNGMTASRVIYASYEGLVRNVNFSPSANGKPDTLHWSNLRSQYDRQAEVQILEDFDGAGLNLEATAQSDTVIRIISDTALTFSNPQRPGENNGKAGAIFTDSKNSIAKIATSNAYQLPTNGDNVYVELTYRCNQGFLVGVIAEVPGQIVEQPTVFVNPSEEWNKIYINLVTELTAFTNAERFKLLFTSQHDDSQAVGKIYIDNIKLVY